MPYICILACAAVLLIVWAASDRVIFHGFAPVRLGEDKKPTPFRRSVVVLPPLHLRLGAYVVSGVVSQAKAEQIFWTPNAKRMVVLRRRLFGKVRVTQVDQEVTSRRL